MYKACRCPVWVQGVLDGKKIRESLKTSNWQKAQETIREWEVLGIAKPRVTVSEACSSFTEDAAARNLRQDTLDKYDRLLRDLQRFATEKKIQFANEFDVDLVRKFRATWPDSNISAAKKLERLVAFFSFAQESGWLADNPAKKVKKPKIDTPPTLPFERDEMGRILAATERYPDNYGRTGGADARRLHALTLLMRYSGLSIRDAVTLPKERLKEDRLFLRRHKTGVPVMCKLPPFAVEALHNCPGSTPAYFFWTGTSNPKSVVGNWQRSFRKLFTLVGIKGGHPHRFRDTFAVELLLAGTPIDRVSVLLGHTSVRTTEKHYAPWVRARQEQLEADIERSWNNDPFLISKVTNNPKVHALIVPDDSL
jgi:integrase